LIDGFIQTVLAATAIDQMAKRLLRGNTFDTELFGSINKDDSFINELMPQRGLQKEV